MPAGFTPYRWIMGVDDNVHAYQPYRLIGATEYHWYPLCGGKYTASNGECETCAERVAFDQVVLYAPDDEGVA